MTGVQAKQESHGRRIIAVLEKSAHDEIVVDLQTYNGREYIGIRIFDIHQDRRVPTTKGLTLGVDQLPTLVRALQDAQAALQSAPLSAPISARDE